MGLRCCNLRAIVSSSSAVHLGRRPTFRAGGRGRISGAQVRCPSSDTVVLIGEREAFAVQGFEGGTSKLQEGRGLGAHFDHVEGKRVLVSGRSEVRQRYVRLVNQRHTHSPAISLYTYVKCIVEGTSQWSHISG